MAQIVDDALETIAKAWHVLDGARAAIAPEAAPLTGLASKIMGLVAAGDPLTAASEAALSVLVDVFKDAEAHRAAEAPPVRTGSPAGPALLPIETQAAAAVAASGGSVSDATAAPAAADPSVQAEAPAPA